MATRKYAVREVTETLFYLQVSEQDLIDLSAGYVPNSIKGMARTSLDWSLED